MNTEKETYRKIAGPTPAGGEYAILYFFDESGNHVIEEHAKTAIGVEFDKNNNIISETNFILDENKNEVEEDIKGDYEEINNENDLENTLEFPRIR